MSQSVPDFTTAIITILFLLVLAAIGFVIKIKSGSLKKIIKKQEDLEVLHHSPLRNGGFLLAPFLRRLTLLKQIRND